MCGITFIHSDKLNEIDCEKTVNKIQHRGPDNEKYVSYKNKVFFGFNRLAINDKSEEAMQPFNENETWLICNGEIFNWKELVEKYELEMRTNCDCEVIIRLYNKFIVDYDRDVIKVGQQLCNVLDGEFAFVIYDETMDKVLAARDPYGVRPMFFGKSNDSFNTYMYCSEMKGIHSLCKDIEQFRPGCFMIDGREYIQYTSMNDIKINPENEEYFLKEINTVFRKAVEKRLMSDREICCLLSGGLDSSLVAGLVSQHFPPHTVKTFSIGLKGSTDLEYAQKVAEHIKSDHTNIEVSKEEFLNAIEEVIHTIESYDTTTVRASVGNYLVSKYIKDNTDCKVVFNGDYSDEVCGGYKYMSQCDDEDEFHKECIRLVEDIHFFDSLRSDRCISAHGLEARVPFADKDFVKLYKSIPMKMRMSNERIEKYMLRKAFDNDDIIPHDVLWRKKEAFSDGVSSPEDSWHNIIKMHVETQLLDIEYDKMTKDEVNPVNLKETAYYKSIFNKYFNFQNIIPYYWLPKYCGSINDPSAREI